MSKERPVFFTENFALPDAEHFYNRAMQLVAGRTEEGPGTWWHGRECSAVMGGALWGWFQDGANSDPDAQQYLAKLVGGKWERGSYPSFPASLFNWRSIVKCAGVLVSCGTRPNADGLIVPVWCIDDGRARRELESPYFLLYGNTCPNADGDEEIIAVAWKVVAGAFEAVDGTLVEHILRIRPQAKQLCATYDAVNTRWSWTLSSVTAAGYDATTWPAFLWWKADAGLEGGGVWVPKTAAPGDATVYLEKSLTVTLVRYTLHAGQTLPYDAG